MPGRMETSVDSAGRCKFPSGGLVGRGCYWSVNSAIHKKTPRQRGFFMDGGERGIRTLDTFPYTHFPGVLLQPLGHLSRFLNHCSSLANITGFKSGALGVLVDENSPGFHPAGSSYVAIPNRSRRFGQPLEHLSRFLNHCSSLANITGLKSGALGVFVD